MYVPTYLLLTYIRNFVYSIFAVHGMTMAKQCKEWIKFVSQCFTLLCRLWTMASCYYIGE